MGIKKSHFKKLGLFSALLLFVASFTIQAFPSIAKAADTASVAEQANIWSLLQYYKPGGNCSFRTPIGIEEVVSGDFINGTGTNQVVGWQMVSGGEGKLCTKML